VSENKTLRTTSEPNREKLNGKFRILHDEELSDLYKSPGIVTVVKPTRMRWAEHVARIGIQGMHTEFW
jgi:hypothetical protein